MSRQGCRSHVPASFAACFFSGRSGGGAGLILLPVLLFTGLAFINALASHKLAVGFIGVGSTLSYDQLYATSMTLAANGIFWNRVGAVDPVFMGHVIWPLAPGLSGRGSAGFPPRPASAMLLGIEHRSHRHVQRRPPIA
ncbi:hypothetical protein CKO31_14395 [Thiohalocapsa halophila]|uniref:Uncharacterized protein n=1 Tax=Thiohalocapsa halophila TaxID=69359 RepID=A0ABS1CJC0_9GAMM|nr:hypothetical protein [Thiohalocapsa halophila]MBK1631902.1 hypothetical protein [Thiohalocapsa halophila]